MVSTKTYIRNVHEPLQDGEEVNIIADATIQEFNAFLVQLANMKASVQIDTATGDDLDVLASLFGLTREIGETDTQFRARIKAFFPGTIGSGTINELKNTVNRVTGIPLADITITEIESAKFRMTVAIGGDFTLINTMRNIIWNIKSAGVYPFFLWEPLIEEGVTVTESYQIVTVGPSIGIIVSAYDVGSTAVV